MNIRKLHTIIGLTLLVPFLCWIITALVFYFKPGYDEAYEFLEIKTYPLTSAVSVVPDSGWTEFRCVKTILGDHLLARTPVGWKNLDPVTKKLHGEPTDTEIRTLLADAFSANPARYGQVATISHDTIITTTHVEVILNWSRLSLQQRGKDTDRIDLLYKIHYLQWTGNKTLDKILGPLGLGLILSLSGIGLVLAFTKKK